MLTDEQRNFFKSNGYLVVEGVLDEATVLAPIRAEYAALLDDLISGWTERGLIKPPPAGDGFFEKLLYCYANGMDWFQPMDISLPGDRITPETPFHFGPAVFNLLRNERLLSLVEDLLGPELTSNPIQHVRLKPPTSRLSESEVRAHITHTDWHQDRGVTHHDADQTDMVTVWCAMTDATINNGCLQVVPQSDTTGLLPHCPKVQTAIADGLVDYNRAVPLPVKSGGVVIFDPLTPHASLDNHSDHFRWSFDIRFNKTGQPTGRNHFPSFVARSRENPSSELTDWKRWRQSWVDARARLAAAPHIPIHRWQADSPACA